MGHDPNAAPAGPARLATTVVAECALMRMPNRGRYLFVYLYTGLYIANGYAAASSVLSFLWARAPDHYSMIVRCECRERRPLRSFSCG